MASNQPAGQPQTHAWWRVARPFLWWLLLVLAMFGYRENQIWLARTRIEFSATLNGQALGFEAVTKLDGQPVVAGQIISLGSHTLTISHPKAELFSTNFSGWYGRNIIGEIKMKRCQGTLNVQAMPPASTITITGPEFSKTLNDSAGANLTVPTDAYEIRADYPHWSQSKNVTVFNQLAASCVFSPQFGVLHLTCNHDGATFRLHFASGQSVDSGDVPAMITGLPAGSYQVTALYHHRPLEKTIVLAAGVTNETPLEFVLGTARLESVPPGAEVHAADGSLLGQTPLDLPDLTPQTAQYDLSLEGYEPVSVTVAVVADQTTTARTNLLSVRYVQALREARQYLDAGNNERAFQTVGEALTLKPDDAVALALQATATENLKLAQQRADAEKQQVEVEKQRVETERKQAEAERQRLERLKQPRLVFAKLCSQNPDAAMFAEQELKTSKPAKDVEAAIVKSLQAAPLGFTISYDGLTQPETYQITGGHTFSLGILGGYERLLLLVVGQTKDDETQILFKVLEYQIKHTVVNLSDQKQLIPMHSSRMQMNETDQRYLQEGLKLVTERIQTAIQQVQ
jgi:hypothetical protein